MLKGSNNSKLKLVERVFFYETNINQEVKRSKHHALGDKLISIIQSSKVLQIRIAFELKN